MKLKHICSLEETSPRLALTTQGKQGGEAPKEETTFTKWPRAASVTGQRTPSGSQCEVMNGAELPCEEVPHKPKQGTSPIRAER